MFFLKKYLSLIFVFLFITSTLIIQYYSISHNLTENNLISASLPSDVYILRLFLTVLLSVVLAPVAEELLFRGWLQDRFKSIVSPCFVSFILISIVGEITKIFYNTTIFSQVILYYNNYILNTLNFLNIRFGLSDVYNTIFFFLILGSIGISYLFFKNLQYKAPKIYTKIGMLVSSVFFVLWHISSYENFDLGNIINNVYFSVFIVIFLNWAVRKTNIVGAILIHIFANFSGVVMEDLLLFSETHLAHVKYLLYISFVLFTIYMIYWFTTFFLIESKKLEQNKNRL